MIINRRRRDAHRSYAFRALKRTAKLIQSLRDKLNLKLFHIFPADY